MLRQIIMACAISFAGLAIAGWTPPAMAGSAFTEEAEDIAIAGTYAVQGDSFAGGAPYDGKVIVEKTGKVYKVTWYPGPGQIEGIGIYAGGLFSVGYLQEGVQGVAVYEPNVTGFNGVWSELGETRLAPETWVKK